MPKMIFVNLPVTDIARATAFHETMGAVRNPQFSTPDTSMMVISETIYVILMTHERFAGFTSKKIVDAKTSAQALLCLTAESRDEVDAIIAKAGAAGGRMDPNPKQDYGFMYGRSYEDPDGHEFEITWMDVAAATEAMSQENDGPQA